MCVWGIPRMAPGVTAGDTQSTAERRWTPSVLMSADTSGKARTSAMKIGTPPQP